ncbi:hypothetical protein NHX12_029564, partial [Muraenolepis orangiensis]
PALFCSLQVWEQQPRNQAALSTGKGEAVAPPPPLVAAHPGKDSRNRVTVSVASPCPWSRGNPEKVPQTHRGVRLCVRTPLSSPSAGGTEGGDRE